MNYENSWVVTCGLICLIPIGAFATGAWFARNAARVNWSALSTLWRRER